MSKRFAALVMMVCILFTALAFGEETIPSLNDAACIAPGDSRIEVTTKEDLAVEVTNAQHGQQPTNMNSAEENSTVLKLIYHLLPRTVREMARELNIEAELGAVIDLDESMTVTGGSQRLAVPENTKATVEMDVDKIEDAEKVAVVLIPYDSEKKNEAVAAERSGKRIRFQFESETDLYTILIVKELPKDAGKGEDQPVIPVPSVKGSTINDVTWTGKDGEWVILTPIEELVDLVEKANIVAAPTNGNTAKENEDILYLLQSLMPQTVKEVTVTYGVNVPLESMLIDGRSIDMQAMVTGGSLRVSEGLVDNRVTIAMKVAGISEGDWAAILMIPYAEGKPSMLQSTRVTGKETEFSFVPDTVLYTFVVIKDVAAVDAEEESSILNYYIK